MSFPGLVIKLAWIATTILAASAHAQADSRSSTPIPWSRFAWAPAQLGGGRIVPRGALLLPVELEDAPRRRYYLQLDTGAGWPLWYEVPLRRILPRAIRGDTAPDQLVLRGAIGSHAFASDTFVVRKAFGDAPDPESEHTVIGTLGLRFLRDRTLVLDFPRQRFAILDSAQRLPPELLARASFAPIIYRHGHAFVPLRLAGQLIEDFFYDSGASLFPLTTTAATWRALTRRTGSEADNVYWHVSSWGATIEMIGAPLAGLLEIGVVRAERPLVFHQRPDSTRPNFFTTAPYHVGGHFGNALFYDRYVLIVDLARRRFGLVEEP